MKKGMVLWAIVVLILTLVMPTWGAEAPKPGTTLQQMPQQSPPSKIMPIVRGHVKLSGIGIGIPYVEITLSNLSRGGAIVMHQTDSAGFYSFTIPYEDIGKNYKIVPKYANWPSGKNFTPNEKTFAVANVANTIDFLLIAPDLAVGTFNKQMLSASEWVLTFNIKNEGEVPAGPFKVHVYEQCTPGCAEREVIVYDVPGLAAGGSRSFTPPNRWNIYTDRIFRIKIDNVNEFDWHDNESSFVYKKERER